MLTFDRYIPVVHCVKIIVFTFGHVNFLTVIEKKTDLACVHLATQ